MADGVGITAGSGTTIATDDAGAGGHAQIVKLAISTDGSVTLIPGDTANGLDVDVTRLPALVASTAAIGKLAANSGVDIGDVDVTSVPADPFGANADAVVAAGATGSIQAKLRRATQGLEDLKSLIVLAAGNNNIGDVDVASVPADPFGATADASVAAGATGSISAKLRRATQGLEDLKTLIVLGAGTNAIGKLAANSGVDIGDVDVTSLPAEHRPGTATTSSVADTASSTQLLASTVGRRGAYFYNDTTVVAYVKLGTTASATDFTVQLGPGAFWELPNPCYTGRIDCIWASDASGSMRITELT